MRLAGYIRNTGVVKNAVILTDATHSAEPTGGAPTNGEPTSIEPVPGSVDHRTRDRVADLLLERGSATAAELGEALGLSPAAIRRHLDAMLAAGDVLARDQRISAQRGRGRPARIFLLTERARGLRGAHTYDDLAVAALRWISAEGGEAAVAAFAAQRVAGLATRCESALADAGDGPLDRAEALAEALSAEGYAATATAIADGGQLCQHHCPVAHVAAEFPQLCEAETKVISHLVGTHVQRLATIAHGDGVCTTFIPATVAGQPPRTAQHTAGQNISAERMTNS